MGTPYRGDGPLGPYEDGDQARSDLEAVFRAHLRALHGYAVANTPVWAAPDDIVAEAFARLAREVLRQQVRDPRAWLFKTARHRIVDAYRDRPDLVPGDEEWRFEVEGNAPDIAPDLLEQHERETIFWEVIAPTLSAADADLLRRHYREDLSVKELAVILSAEGGKPVEENALYVRLHRARKAFMARLLSWLLMHRGLERCPKLEEELATSGATFTAEAHATIEAHRQECEKCTAEAQAWSSASGVLGGLALVPVTPDLAGKIWSDVLARAGYDVDGAGDDTSGATENEHSGDLTEAVGESADAARRGAALMAAGACAVVVLLLALIPNLGGSVGPAPRVMFVLDTSSSMNTELGNGSDTRLTSATGAMAQVAREFDDDTPIGFSAFGANCDPQSLIIPAQAGAADEVIEAGQTLDADGDTPIATALRKAAAELAPDAQDGGRGERIVLLTDGEETCGGDPAAVARTLHETHPDLQIHTVGFLVDNPTGAELARISEAGGGSFVEAEKPSQLEPALERSVRARRAPAAWWWLALICAGTLIVRGWLQRRARSADGRSGRLVLRPRIAAGVARLGNPRLRSGRTTLVIAIVCAAVVTTALVVLIAGRDPDTTGLQLAVDFDDASGSHVADGSDNRRRGDLHGAELADGRDGKAGAFTGDATEVVKFGDVLDLTEAMTVEAWVKPGRLQGWDSIVANADYPSGYWLGGSEVPGGFEWWVDDQVARVDTGAEPGRWHHVAGTFDARTGKMTLYVNGQAVATANHEGRAATNDEELGIGLDPNSGWGMWHGLIDDVRIWSSARSSDQICSDAGGTPGRSGTCDA